MSVAAILGLRIRFYRKQRKLSQEQLAELCDLHPSYIGQIERGEKNISVEILHRLSLGLEIPMKDLLQDFDSLSQPLNPLAAEIYSQLLQITDGDLKRMKKLFDDILDIIRH